MFEAKNIKRSLLPTILSLLIILAVYLLTDPLFPEGVKEIFSTHFYMAFSYEMVAYVTNWKLVLQKGRGNVALWINYVFWTVFALVAVFVF